MSRQAAVVLAAEVGGHTPMFDGLEAASETFKRGAFLVFASGLIAEGGANPRDIVGLALSDASGVTNQRRSDAMLIPGVTRLEMSLDSAGDLGNEPLAQTMVGSVFGVTEDADGIWYVDVDKTDPGTTAAVVVLGFVDPIGATTDDVASNTNSGGARVIVTLLSEASFLQTDAA